MHWTGVSQEVFGYALPDWFSAITTAYVLLCFGSLLLHWGNTVNACSTHLLLLLIIDFIALVSMSFTSGGISGGLGYLLLIPIAVGSTFLRGKTSLALAAFASILILLMSVASIKIGLADLNIFFSAGLTGVSLFVTAIVFRVIAEKIQTSEYRAQQQAEQANYLQLISQRIVETMRTGIIVIDHDLRIQLINRAAASLLTVNNKFEGVMNIKAISEHLSLWQEVGAIPNTIDFTLANNQHIKVSFANLEGATNPSIMLFIEDMQRLNQEAQHLKLASLGRLSASIAHEIRNPLGAISHASQLLDESESINKSDKQLLTIIHNHSQRINYIINNILDFSRRKRAAPEVINIQKWLQEFKDDYLEHHPTVSILITTDMAGIQAKIDPNHLYQIINNLTDNGIRYSKKNINEAKIDIHIGIQQSDERPYIDIRDYGEGIPKDKHEHIFEPFFTTEPTGSGLGLYLCRELSEANQANLSYSYDDVRKSSTFRLTMAHTSRRIELT